MLAGTLCTLCWCTRGTPRNRDITTRTSGTPTASGMRWTTTRYPGATPLRHLHRDWTAPWASALAIMPRTPPAPQAPARKATRRDGAGQASVSSHRARAAGVSALLHAHRVRQGRARLLLPPARRARRRPFGARRRSRAHRAAAADQQRAAALRSLRAAHAQAQRRQHEDGSGRGCAKAPRARRKALPLARPAVAASLRRAAEAWHEVRPVLAQM